MKRYLILVSLLLLVSSLFNPGKGKLYDSPRYICLAQSIAQGNGYRFIFDPNNKKCFYNNYIFPFLLTPLVRLFGTDIKILQAFILMLSLLCILCFYNWSKLYLNTREAFYLSLLFLTLPIFIYFSNKVLTEIPFLLFLLLSFYIFELWDKNRKFPQLILLAVFIYLTIFTRIVGIALLASLAFYSLKERKKQIAILSLVAFIATIITILIIQHGIQPEDRYYHLKYFLSKNPFTPEMGKITTRDLFLRFIENSKFYLTAIGREIIKFPAKPLFLSIATLIPIIWGMATTRLKSIYSFFLGIYLLSYIIWPWRDIRFLMPISFLLLFYFYLGIKYLISHFPPSGKKLIYTSILVISISGGINEIMVKLTLENVYTPEIKEFQEMAEWSKNHLKNNSVILSSNPELVYLISARKGVFLIYTHNLDKITSYIKKEKVTHILADRYNAETMRYIYPWINKNRKKLNLLKIIGGTALFKLN